MMNRYLTRILPIAILALGVAFTGFTGCAGGDMATVTISVGNITAKAQKPSVVDRIIAFFSLSTKLQAGPPTFEYIDRLDLTIEGPGMDVITRDIPLETGVITVEIPSGPKRVFTVVAYESYEPGDPPIRSMGGISTKDLAPGASETIPIEMGWLLPPPDTLNGIGRPIEEEPLKWSYVDGDPEGLVGFRVFRAQYTSPPPLETRDPFLIYRTIAIGRKERFAAEEDSYKLDDPIEEGAPAETHHYFGVAAINKYGEGEPSFERFWWC